MLGRQAKIDHIERQNLERKLDLAVEIIRQAFSAGYEAGLDDGEKGEKQAWKRWVSDNRDRLSCAGVMPQINLIEE